MKQIIYFFFIVGLFSLENLAAQNSKCVSIPYTKETSIKFTDSISLSNPDAITFHGNVSVSSFYIIEDAQWVAFYGNDSIVFFDPTGGNSSLRGGRIMLIKNERKKNIGVIIPSKKVSKIYY